MICGQPSFIPQRLDSDIDARYYDDFNSVEDIAKYAEADGRQNSAANVKEKEDPVGRGVRVESTCSGRMGSSAKAMGIDGGGVFTTMF